MTLNLPRDSEKSWGRLGVPVQFKIVSMRARESPYALHPVSRDFPQCCPWNSSNVCLIDDGPFSSQRIQTMRLYSLFVLSRKIVERFLFLRLSPSGDRRSMVWCPWLCARRQCRVMAMHSHTFAHTTRLFWYKGNKEVMWYILSYWYQQKVPPRNFKLT